MGVSLARALDLEGDLKRLAWRLDHDPCLVWLAYAVGDVLGDDGVSEAVRRRLAAG